MASTFTTRIRLEKQGTGDNDSTWGTVLNENVIDLLDAAIAGYTTISLASGNVSLTSNDGSSDEARSAILELTGTLTTATNVYVPAVSKWYLVRNNTSGSFSTNILITGGTGVTVPQGGAYVVYSDGVSVRPISVEYASSAGTATSAAFATSATNATSATFATSATNATTAVSATNATNVTGGIVSATDGTFSGNVSASAYYGDGSNLSGVSSITPGAEVVLNPYALTASVTEAHTLGAVPSFYHLEFECLTAELGYSVGDKFVGSQNGFVSGAGGGYIMIIPDSTNTTVLTNSGNYTILDKSTKAANAFTPANWKLTVTPYLVS